MYDLYTDQKYYNIASSSFDFWLGSAVETQLFWYAFSYVWNVLASTQKSRMSPSWTKRI